MNEYIKKTAQSLRQRLSLKVIVGGRTGIVAWGLSGAGALAVLVWGIKLMAVPLLMIKTASWGLWGVGVIRESRTRKSALSEVEPGDKE